MTAVNLKFIDSTLVLRIHFDGSWGDTDRVQLLCYSLQQQQQQ